MNNKNQQPYYIFIDLDETLISIKSMFHFLKFYFSRFKLTGNLRYLYCLYKIKALAHFGSSREQVNRAFYQFFRGIQEELLEKICQEWFQKIILENKKFFHSNMLLAVKKHKANGGIPVLVSGSFAECVKPIAEYCDIPYFLAIKLEKDAEKKCTGKILPPQTIGHGKAVAIKSFLHQQNFNDYTSCFAYGDHISDAPMLELVGNPCAVIHAHNKLFEEYARKKGWQIMQGQ